MTIRFMSVTKTDTYHYIKAIRFEFQATNGIKGAHFVWLTKFNDEEFAIQYEPTEEVIDIWND